MRCLTLLVLVTLGSMFYGCGSKMPAGFPETAPCTITVKNGSAPISGAEVFLSSEDKGEQGKSLGKFTIKGTTDTAGTATIETIGQGASATGAPVGGFFVYIKKEPPYPEGKPQEELDSMDEKTRSVYEQQLKKEFQALPREVPSKYSNAATSGLKIQVEAAKGGTLDVDVSK